MSKLAAAVKEVGKLSFPFQTQSPFLFCVYHIDHFPAGNAKCEAPRHGSGSDFDWSQPYRMYHGDRIPGFPSHPHRGFETLTATLAGTIDHADSLGNEGRYGGDGDLQWMTAGKGIQHCEMFPLVNQDRDNFSKFFQIWLNLPKKSKMVEPSFVMHWGETTQRVTTDAYSVVVWAGEFEGARGQQPPPHSWASEPDSDVAVWHITLQPGGTLALPAAATGAAVHRRVYTVEGGALSVAGRVVEPKHFVTLDAAVDGVALHNADANTPVELLLLQGRPIDEPVVQHGPFVMNTRAEIVQAFADFQETQFGGWPYAESGVVFPRTQTRFAKINGVLSEPPAADP